MQPGAIGEVVTQSAIALGSMSVMFIEIKDDARSLRMDFGRRRLGDYSRRLAVERCGGATHYLTRARDLGGTARGARKPRS